MGGSGVGADARAVRAKIARLAGRVGRGLTADEREDVVQEAALAYYAYRQKADAADDVVRSVRSQDAFICCLVRSKVMDAYRRRRRTRQIVSLDAVDVEPATRATTEGLALTALAAAEVHEAVRALRDDDRRVFVLHHHLGMSAQEIGAMIGRRPNTISQRLSRARNRIAGALEGGRT